MKERSLITGSHGFLGEHLVRSLEQQGHIVIRGNREGTCPEVIDYIFDLASYGNLYHQKDFGEIYQANFYRFMKMLEIAQDYRAFLYVSTSSVELPYLTFYAAAKLAGEGLARAWANTYKKPVVIVRPFSVTGVGEQEEHFIPRLIRSCLYGEEMPFVPEPVHDFVDVEDVVAAFLILAKNARHHKGEIFEIGSGQQYSNADIKGIVEMITGKKANVREAVSLRPYDTRHWVANPAKLWNLGWKPQKDIVKTIKEMVEHERIRTKNT